jgi:hypothetical protein
VQSFAIELKTHCLEQFEIIYEKSAALDDAGDEDGQAQLEADVTHELYDFLIVQFPDREEVQSEMTLVEDHVI